MSNQTIDGMLVSRELLKELATCIGVHITWPCAIELRALQQRLTAAEERVRELEGLLRKCASDFCGISSFLMAFHAENENQWCGYLDDALGAVLFRFPEIIAALDHAADGSLKPAEGGGDAWKSWSVGNTVRYQGSGQDGEDCYCRMTKGSDYMIHEAPDDHDSMVVLDDDGDELCVLVGEFRWIKP